MSNPKHGGDIKGFAKTAGCLPEQVTDFSSNINPLGLSENLQRVYQESMSELTNYPDPSALAMCHHVAARHHCHADNVIAGNGSIALIDLAIRSLKPKKALLVEPCFNECQRRPLISPSLCPYGQSQGPYEQTS